MDLMLKQQFLTWWIIYKAEFHTWIINLNVYILTF